MPLLTKSIHCLLKSSQLSTLIKPRYIFSCAYNMEKVIENLEKNPYYDKYAQKISKLQNTSPDEFFNKVEALEKKESVACNEGFSKLASKGKTSLPSGAFAFAPQKKLDSIMKVELLMARTPDEIKYIWTQHFITKDAISGIMSFPLYEKIQDRGVKFPMFIFPLPREQGYEFIYCQFAANEIHLTPLINYQAYQENAPECLTMVLYPDLVEEKGIVLMHGEFNKDVINSKEAQFLANEITLYYGGDEEEKLNLLQQFHKAPDKFRHLDLIEQIEKLDVGALTGSKKS